MENKFKAMIERGYVKYSDFNAVGDGIHDDSEALYEAHVFANENGLDVFADEGKTYYVHSYDKPIPVKTNVDFTGAKFILDDTGDVAFENRSIPLFLVAKDNPAQTYTGEELSSNFDVSPINIGDTLIPWLSGKLEAKSLIRFTNEEHRDFVRFGSNVNSGNPRTDCLLVNTDGTIDPDTPVAFPFDTVTKIEIFRTDDKPITLRGGYFETICCQVVAATEFENKWRGYYRSFKIVRSNTTVQDMTHRIVGEPDIPNTGYGRSDDGKLRQSYPYYGFVYFLNTYNSYAKNLALNSHTTYYEDKTTSTKPVAMGSYDIVIEYSSHVYCEGLTSYVDICDTRYWGIMSSNGAKNMEFKNCSMSRFDAHRGFWNARLIGCEFGQTINVIGGGNLEIIDTVRKAGASFIALRNDYGATFNGDIYIKNCTLCGKKKYRGVKIDELYEDGVVIVHSGFNFEKEKFLDWNFGYTCYMPRHITVEGLSSGCPDKTYVFNNLADVAFDESHSNAYRITESVVFKGCDPIPTCSDEGCTRLRAIPTINNN